ncbi:MAG: hypothetical protein IJ209_06285 [Bacteroidaceae bacterium]|nr:hypothetical protein [Bacteroidaceae bacterium]
MNFRRILLITLLSVAGRAALPLCAQTVINVPLEQYPPLQVLSESVNVDLPPEGITLGSDLVVSGGDGIYEYAWTNVSGQTLSQAPTLTVVSPGNYFLTVTDGHECRVSTQFTVIPGTAVQKPEAVAPRQIRLFSTSGQLLKTISGTDANDAATSYGLPAGIYVKCCIYKDGHSTVSKISIPNP